MVSPNLKIETLIQQTNELPSIPAAAMAVLNEVNNPNSNALSISRLLLQDQALATRVLRLANSAYYGLSRQVADLQEAVVILGMRSIRNLALVAGTYPWLTKEFKGYALGPKALWTHSLGVAVGAQCLAKASRKAQPDECFMAGLLHNLGKVVLAVSLEGHLHNIFQLAETENIGFDEAERRYLGYDHCDVGAHLAAKWNLPELFQAAMQYHHTPNQADMHQSIVDCVHLGDYLATTFGLGLGGDGLRYILSSEALDRLGIDSETFEQIVSDFPETFVEYEQMFDSIS